MQTPTDKAETQTNVMLELEHLIGVRCDFNDSLVINPCNSDEYIHAAGSLIVKRQFSDKHVQAFLRGHTECVTSLDISPNGELIASGQGACPNLKDASVVLLWDYKKETILHTLEGITGDVTQVSFTPDNRYIAAVDSNGVFYMWDAYSYETIIKKSNPKPISSFKWSSVDNSGKNVRHPTYKVIVTHGIGVYRWELSYEIHHMEYSISSTPFKFPMKGALQRNYTYLTLEAKSEMPLLIATSTAGEVFCFDYSNMIYQTSFQCTKKSATCAFLHNEYIVVGGADGVLCLFNINAPRPEPLNTRTLDGGITTIKMLDEKAGTLVVSTNHSNVYKVDLKTFESSPLIQGNNDEVLKIEFGEYSHIAGVLTSSQMVSFWDLSNYLMLRSLHLPSKAKTFTFHGKDRIMCGHEDGSITCWEWKESACCEWKMSNAHRGSVNSMCLLDQVLLTGGDDGVMRVWNISTRNVIGTFPLMIGKIYHLKPDIQYKALIHGFGENKELITFCMKREAVILRRRIKEGCYTAMCQHRENEREIVTTTSHGQIIIWDPDLSDPLHCMSWNNEDETLPFTSCALSHDGKFLAVVGHDKLVRIIEWSSKKPVGKYGGHGNKILDIQWTPDDKQLVSSDTEGTLCVWNVYA